MASSTSNDLVSGPSRHVTQSKPNNKHQRTVSTSNNQRAQLADAYSSLGAELSSEKLKIVGSYTLGRTIGEGTFGSVFMGTHRLSNTRVAIKKVPKNLTSQLTREIHHHRALHHPYILQLYEVIATEATIWMVTELCTGGELFDYLVERGRLLESEARRVFGELTVAVGTLHRKGTVHRDLKLENVLLDGHCGVKLGDLGFARDWRRGDRMLETFCGTTGYASPEMLRGIKYAGEEVDIWSLGIILYTLLCGGLPFDDDDEEVMKGLIYEGEYDEPEWLSSEAKDLIKGLLQLEPTKRLSIREILSHPWFTKQIVDPPLEELLGNSSHLQGVQGPPDHGPITPFLSSPDSEQLHHYFPRHGHTVGSFTNSHNYIPNEPSPLSSPRIQPRHVSIQPTSESEEGSSSQASFDFHVSDKETSVVSLTTTANTTGGDDDEHADMLGDLSGNSSIRPELRTEHSNESETTIRKPSQEETPKRKNNQTHISEESMDISLLNMGGTESKRHSGVFDEHFHLPLAEHSRTPSRTKRRSLSASITEHLRPSMTHSHSHTSQAIPVVDYLAQLDETPPPFFSTTSEKRLLESLSLLGFDIGQVMHSVNSDACDASSALWWILRAKQAEREHEQQHSPAMERTLSERSENQHSFSRLDSLRLTEAFNAPAMSTDQSTIKASRKDPDMLPPTLGPPIAVEEVDPIQGRAPLRDESPPREQVRRSSGTHTSGTGNDMNPASPEKHVKKDAKGEKNRSASFSMLQRATSALTGSTLVRKKSQDKLIGETLIKSPKMLLKTPPSTRTGKKDGGSGMLELPVVMDVNRQRQGSNDSSASAASAPNLQASTSYGTVETLASLSSSLNSLEESPSKSKSSGNAGRKEGLLTTFKSWWNEGQRKKPKTTGLGLQTYGTPSKAPGMRSQHHPAVKRTTVVARRSPADAIRPGLNSRKSSSANSRRSSITSLQLPSDFLHQGDAYGLHRRGSRRSTGSRTPTSEAEFPGGLSRASSVHSLVRTPSGTTSGGMQSYHHQKSGSASSGQSGGKVPTRPPRPHIRGTTAASRRAPGDRHHLRSPSATSSIRSAASSRRSSLLPDPVDSGDDSASTRSRRKHLSVEDKHYHPAVLIAHRTRSPLSATFPTQRPRSKVPIRDVFAKKPVGDTIDDEWIDDDDEERGFAGGLGQCSSASVGKQFKPPPIITGTGDSPTIKSKFASNANQRYGGRAKTEGTESPTPSPTDLANPIARTKVENHPPPPIARGGFSRFPSLRPADVMEEEEPEE